MKEGFVIFAKEFDNVNGITWAICRAQDEAEAKTIANGTHFFYPDEDSIKKAVMNTPKMFDGQIKPLYESLYPVKSESVTDAQIVDDKQAELLRIKSNLLDTVDMLHTVIADITALVK